MRILVTGADGQLGNALAKNVPAWAEVIFLGRQVLNITDEAAIGRAFEGVDWVINAAARTDVDILEMNPRIAFEVNCDGAANVARACKRNGAKLMQLSTEYVFDGSKGGAYSPSDATNPLNVYGESKFAGEVAVIDELGEDAVVPRTSWLYSDCGVNFVLKMLDLMKQKGELKVVDDQIGSPTWSRNLVDCCWSLIHNDASGVHHWSDAGVASRYDFAVAIHELACGIGILDTDCEIAAATSEEFNFIVRRPYCCVLDTSRTEKASGCQRANWRSSLREMLMGLL